MPSAPNTDLVHSRRRMHREPLMRGLPQGASFAHGFAASGRREPDSSSTNATCRASRVGPRSWVCFVSVTGLPFAIVVRSSRSPERGFLRQAAVATVAGAPDALAGKDLCEVADRRLLLTNRGRGKLCDLGRIDSSLVSRRRRPGSLRYGVTIDRRVACRHVRGRRHRREQLAWMRLEELVRDPRAGRRQLGADREAVQLLRGLVQTHRSRHAGREPRTSPEAECRKSGSWGSWLRQCRPTTNSSSSPPTPSPKGRAPTGITESLEITITAAAGASSDRRQATVCLSCRP